MPKKNGIVNISLFSCLFILQVKDVTSIVYFQKLFQFKQSLGVIGGKPNVALYFIGCVGKEVIYLDPHHTQKTGFVENKETEEQIEMDISYHCRYASRINILKMDPSVAAVRTFFFITYY